MNTEHLADDGPEASPAAQDRLAETDINRYAILNPWGPRPAAEPEPPAPESVRELLDTEAPRLFPVFDYVPALGAAGAVLLATCVFMLFGGPARPAPAQPQPAQPLAQPEPPAPEREPGPVFVAEEPGLRVLTDREKEAMRRLEQELSGIDADTPVFFPEDDLGPGIERRVPGQQSDQEKLQESFSSDYWQGLQAVIGQEKTLLLPLPANPGVTKARGLLDQRAAAASRAMTQLDALQPQFVDPQILATAARVRNWYQRSQQLIAEGRTVFAQGVAAQAEWHQQDAAHRQDFQALLAETDALRGQLGSKYRQTFGRLNTSD